MPIPFVRLHDPQPKTEQFSPGMMTNYLFFNRSYLKLSKQEMYHEKLDEFEDHTLLSHIGCHCSKSCAGSTPRDHEKTRTITYFSEVRRLS